MRNSLPKSNTQAVGALHELLDEVVAEIAATRPVILYTDIATLPCNKLVQRVINERGEQAAAVFATKLNGELARRGKNRVVLQRAARNGNGVHVHAAD